MNKTTMKAVIAMMAALLPAIALAGPYEDCILQNMKGVQAQAAAFAVQRACKEKTTPKKCRAAELRSRFVDMEPVADKGKMPWERNWGRQIAPDQTDLDACIKECADASYWSRTFGECSTD